MRIVVAGGTGLIGTPLVAELRDAGDDVTVLVRREPRAAGEFHWDPSTGTLDPVVLEGVDAVINLAGASIARIPWTNRYRRELVSSRVEPTRLLAEAMARMPKPPATFLSGSATGFYGNRPGERLDEASPRGTGFLADLVLAWEQAAALAPAATRVVRLLTSVGLGSKFSSGRQYWPWISLEDEVRAIIHLLDSQLAGPVVLAGPTPATADEVTATFARLQHRPRIWPVPAWAIRFGLGEAGQNLLLDDMHVVPGKLTGDGFAWTHPTIEDAVAAVLSARV